MMANLPNHKTFEEVAHLSSYHPALPGLVQFLTSMVNRGDIKLDGRQPTDRSKFNGCQPAEVSVQDYMIRLCKYGFCSPEVFVQMVIYLSRIRAKTAIMFSSYNIHRLMLTSFVCAAKLRDDIYYTNKYYAKIGGVSLPDINRMEQEFLTHTNWELHVDKNEYDKYVDGLMNASSKKDKALSQSTSSLSSDVAARGADKPAKGTSPLAAVKSSVMTKFQNTFSRSNNNNNANNSLSNVHSN